MYLPSRRSLVRSLVLVRSSLLSFRFLITLLLLFLCLFLPPAYITPLLFPRAKYPVRYTPRAWDPRSLYSMIDGLFYLVKLPKRCYRSTVGSITKTKFKKKMCQFFKHCILLLLHYLYGLGLFASN